MASKTEIQKKVIELEQTAVHFLKLATDLKQMAGVSTPALKRVSSVKMQVREKFNSKLRIK